MGAVKALAAALALLALGACATPQGAAPRFAPGDRYVSMGSSFAAGAGIAPRKANTPARCDRSERNYATLLSQRLGLALVDVGCGGATTAHVTGPWAELPAQVDALTAETRLVTVTIGGNDIGFVGYLFAASCRKGAKLSVQGRELPCMIGKMPAEEAWTRAEAGMDAIAREVKARAPRAQLAFVQYVAMLPEAPCPSANLEAEDLANARQIAARLGAMTARVARRNGALVIAMDQTARGHTTCDALRWSNGIGPGLVAGDGAPWHPTAAGHAAIADELARALGR